jgi:hypothetical protein
MVSATNIQSEQINKHYCSKDCEGWLPNWIFYKLKILLQFAQFGPIHFIGMFGFQPKWQLSIGRGRKSGHHGHNDFSTNPKPYKTQIFTCPFIFLTTYWKYILLMFWVTSFSLYGPTNEGDVGPEWLVFNGKLMGG